MKPRIAIHLLTLLFIGMIIYGYQYQTRHGRYSWGLGWDTGSSDRIIAESGDGKDLLADGKPAPSIPPGTIPSSTPCGKGWISDNASGLAPNPPPSTIRFKRTFDLTDKDLEKGQFVLSFKADDKAEFFVNGNPAAVAACTPPSGNDGECQQTCHVFVIPFSVFRGGSNELDIVLTNLFNVPVGNQFGWTELSYQLKHVEGNTGAAPVSGNAAPTTATSPAGK